MNRIKTTDILDPTIQQPFTGGSLDFLQNANKEVVLAAIIGEIGNSYDSTKAYIISGLYAYGTNQYQEGYVLFGGEIYYSAGKSSVTAFVNVPVLTITITNDVTADPVTFTDGISRSVHNNRKLVLSDAISGTGTFDLSDALHINTWVTQSSPTVIGLTTGDVLVGGGVTGTYSYLMKRTREGISLRFLSTDLDTLATVAKIQMTLPILIPVAPNKTTGLATGFAPCRFYLIGTGGVPCYVWIALTSSGAGTGLTIEKADGTAFGALTNYFVEFKIDISFIL
jgi:hypothetical protein